MPEPIVIVGGGFAGLAAGVRLVDAGHRVLVLEATKAGGGRSRSFEDRVTGREIDNGQHLMMGCYRETQSFLRTIGAPDDAVYYQRNLAVAMVRPGGKRASLQCPGLPAPLHLAAGLLSMSGVGVVSKLSALRAGLLLRSEVTRPDDNETCDAWLSRMGQTAGIRATFWEPLIWAVLNDDPLVASAAMLIAVLDRAFMGTRDASRLGVPKKPLSKLYVDRAVAHIEAAGGEVRFAAPVRELVVEHGRASGVVLKNGHVERAAEVISAVPPHVLLDILPARSRDHWVFRDVARLEVSPIVNLWALLDRPLFDEPFVGLVASPLHWVFDRDVIDPEGARGKEGTLLSVTISGARAFMHDDARVLQDLFEGEMRRFFPDRPFATKAFRAVKEKRATISHAAGTYQRRPETRSPIPGLLLAGDWVRTGIPATIESAVQSGHDAAKVLASARRGAAA